mmetsp:Transcript_5158/g.15736  ORF Transcript_5158/g.15736 Transcript_5158/m.15736 type:complete len:215 (+) Transcript_5158:1766-2410(+)
MLGNALGRCRRGRDPGRVAHHALHNASRGVRRGRQQRGTARGTARARGLLRGQCLSRCCTVSACNNTSVQARLEVPVGDHPDGGWPPRRAALRLPVHAHHARLGTARVHELLQHAVTTIARAGAFQRLFGGVIAQHACSVGVSCAALGLEHERRPQHLLRGAIGRAQLGIDRLDSLQRRDSAVKQHRFERSALDIAGAPHVPTCVGEVHLVAVA